MEYHVQVIVQTFVSNLTGSISFTDVELLCAFRITQNSKPQRGIHMVIQKQQTWSDGLTSLLMRRPASTLWSAKTQIEVIYTWASPQIGACSQYFIQRLRGICTQTWSLLSFGSSYSHVSRDNYLDGKMKQISKGFLPTTADHSRFHGRQKANGTSVRSFNQIKSKVYLQKERNEILRLEDDTWKQRQLLEINGLRNSLTHHVLS